MSRYRRGGKNKRQQSDRRNSSGRLSHWYNHKPVVTVDQLHLYRRKEFGTEVSSLPQPPISLSASPSFDTEYSCHFEPPYHTAEEMSMNRRHAAVPKDELQVEGDAEFSAEYAERYKDMPRERNVAARQGSHIGPFVCADDAAPEGVAFRSEQHDQYVAHPDGRRADNLRPSTGLRMDEGTMDGETEQMANYRKYPTTPHPNAANDQSGVIAPNKSSGSPTRLRPFDISMKEMILTRDSGMLLRPERSFAVIGGHGIERPGNVTIPAFRLQVVECCTSTSCAIDDRRRTDAFLVLNNNNNNNSSHRSHVTYNNNNNNNNNCYSPTGVVGGRGRAGSAGGNRWVKSRQRKMGTVRFFDDRRARFRDTDAGKTVQ